MPVALTALALAGAGCGAEDHPNTPRPPKPIEVSANVDNRHVTVSPDRFGAGTVVFTIANQGDSEATLTIDGPVEETSGAILPGTTNGALKVAMEAGDYVVSAGSQSTAAPAELRVGPERPSSQDELDLP